VGDARPQVAALVTLDPEAVAAWLDQHGRPPTPVADLTTDPALLAELRTAVDRANEGVSGAEEIKKFRVLPIDFTEAGGQMTPSLKLKRSVIMSEFATDVEALYPAR
jgi:long-chain acyl-CoA synthetase